MYKRYVYTYHPALNVYIKIEGHHIPLNRLKNIVLAFWRVHKTCAKCYRHSTRQLTGAERLNRIVVKLPKYYYIYNIYNSTIRDTLRYTPRKIFKKKLTLELKDERDIKEVGKKLWKIEKMQRRLF